MAVITISRQHGSGGDEVAARVCELLGYRYFDKALMAEVAYDAGLSEDEVVDFSEAAYEAPSFLDRLVSLLTLPAGEAPTVARVSTWQRDRTGAKVRAVEELGESRTVAVVGQTIHAAHKLGEVVIVGRGGQAVLKAKPDVLHVRLEAPMEARVKRVQDQEGLSEREAERRIGERERASSRYVRRFYDQDWSDPMLYHVVINTGRWSVEAAAQLIVHGVGLLLPEAAS
jgi:cytidylate kinase